MAAMQEQLERNSEIRGLGAGFRPNAGLARRRLVEGSHAEPRGARRRILAISWNIMGCAAHDAAIRLRFGDAVMLRLRFCYVSKARFCDLGASASGEKSKSSLNLKGLKQLAPRSGGRFLLADLNK